MNKAWLTQYYSFCTESKIQLQNALVLERFRIVFTENSSFGMKFRNGQVFSKMKEPCLILIHFLSVSSRYRETSRIELRRQCGPVVRALALRSGDSGFKTRSEHSLNLFPVVPCR